MLKYVFVNGRGTWESVEPIPKVLNRYHLKGALPSNAVYVGRPSKFGNPFCRGKDGTRDEVIEKHREDVYSRPEFLHEIRTELKGKDLVCYCAPRRCHADTLLEIANS